MALSVLLLVGKDEGHTYLNAQIRGSHFGQFVENLVGFLKLLLCSKNLSQAQTRIDIELVEFNGFTKFILRFRILLLNDIDPSEFQVNLGSRIRPLLHECLKYFRGLVILLIFDIHASEIEIPFPFVRERLDHLEKSLLRVGIELLCGLERTDEHVQVCFIRFQLERLAIGLNGPGPIACDGVDFSKERISFLGTGDQRASRFGP